VYVNLHKTGTSEVLFVAGYKRWGGLDHDPTPLPKRDTLKKRKKNSKLLIFSTECILSMGLQYVIKKQGQNFKTFLRYAHRHFNDPNRVGSL
jgi:hypothetical protein